MKTFVLTIKLKPFFFVKFPQGPNNEKQMFNNQTDFNVNSTNNAATANASSLSDNEAISAITTTTTTNITTNKKKYNIRITTNHTTTMNNNARDNGSSNDKWTSEINLDNVSFKVNLEKALVQCQCHCLVPFPYKNGTVRKNGFFP